MLKHHPEETAVKSKLKTKWVLAKRREEKKNSPYILKFSIKFGFQSPLDNTAEDCVNAERAGAKCKCLCHAIAYMEDQ